MKWEDGRRSDNIEDRRGTRPRVGTGVKVGGGAILLIAVISLLLGQDPTQVLRSIEQTQGPAAGDQPLEPGTTSPEDDRTKDFVSVVLADTEDTWNRVFQERGGQYQPPRLVLFEGEVDSACGFASAAVGPFYCPGDQKVYLDLSFFRELDQRFGAPGDFAQAYVVAHEIGHHMQLLLGVEERVSSLRPRLSPEARNSLQVRMELQADCFAGVWGHHAHRDRHRLEPGDAEEGLQAAASIGDDRLQREAQGRIQPESWTHGSSEMRVRWLRRGLESGRIEDCDTFNADRL